MSYTRKGIPAAFALVNLPKATKIAKAEGKLALMQRTRELTNDGEKILSFLIRVLDGDGATSDGLTAAKLLLSYGWGKPVEVQVTADLTEGRGSSSLGGLSDAQLEAVVTSKALPSGEPEPSDE